MSFPRYQFTLTGMTPLLMHADDVQQADELEQWRKAPENKGKSKAGDDRSPAWTWQTYLYWHDGHLCMPAENIMAALRKAGAQLILKKQKTFKEASQSGIFIEGAPQLLANGKQVPMSKIVDLRDKPFPDQVSDVKKLGFALHMKRATVGSSKHVRVRPCFEEWSVSGTLEVINSDITEEVLRQLLALAGRGGLGDWRPTAPKSPGRFGMFTSEVVAI